MSTYTHYDMLDLDCDATQEEIRHAYKVLAMKWHPDRNKAKYAAERFMKIKEAYDVLSDKRRRAEYDEMLNDDTAEASGSVLDDEEAVTEIIVVSKQLLRNGKADAIVLRYMGEEGLKTSEALWLLGKIKASLEKEELREEEEVVNNKRKTWGSRPATKNRIWDSFVDGSYGILRGIFTAVVYSIGAVLGLVVSVVLMAVGIIVYPIIKAVAYVVMGFFSLSLLFVTLGLSVDLIFIALDHFTAVTFDFEIAFPFARAALMFAIAIPLRLMGFVDATEAVVKFLMFP